MIKHLPGRELDALIAERVMGIKVTWETVLDEEGCEYQQAYEEKHGTYRIIDEIQNYSTDIAAAWTVIEKIKAEGSFVDFQLRWGDLENYEAFNGYSAFICVGSGVSWKHSESAPHAICLAALKVIE